ncbi:Similar to DNAJC17: DnaJ homolog subfamily C member 17 (Homo sapiens) [Cotesia congregata]|uniref:Similar to DNAJC17: DnaJ homolog subfamily C member 17 (Homo sapiens) n=1 Tax=Cotesia congregata TaxID=51543 RepID=A0A8J2H9G7_COTCN|nr:Similar to DNAJC17: DnaJ homolog subfamily C member 17 (Homo sapiens) [Cotesia congregata]
MEEDLMNVDLYGELEIESSATEKEIKTAYRKKALSCHPDKNPNNPSAAKSFHRLSRILEILIDKSARAAYDRILNAKIQAKLNNAKLDSKRRKLKEDLEAREEAYRLSQLNKQQSFKTDEEVFKAEVERLKKEGSRQVQEEIDLMNKQIYEQVHGSKTVGVNDTRVNIRWKAEKNDPDNGRALAEFKDSEAAKMAVQIETGYTKNPLTLSGLWESKSNNSSPADSSTTNSSIRQRPTSQPSSALSFSSAPDIFTKLDADFENSVLNNLKRAEERKRMMDQMKDDDS